MANKNPVLDSFETIFSSYEEMHDFHKKTAEESTWRKAKIGSFSAIPLCKEDDGNIANWGKCTPTVDLMEAVDDTTENARLGLSVELLPVYEGEGLFTEETLKAEQKTLPLRDTAVRSMYDRAGLSGPSLGLFNKEVLANTLNEAFKLYPDSESLVLIRNGKITACHSNGYAVLPVDELLETLVSCLEEKFGSSTFVRGYTNHSFVTADFKLENAKGVLTRYVDRLRKMGHQKMADNLVPAIKFSTSDTGISSARCTAYLTGGGAPIAIGSTLEVEHKGKATVTHFGTKVDMMFAQFDRSLAKLEKLMDVYIHYPVSCMERVCRALKLPKKYYKEAVSQFEMVNGDTPCTAHDIYIAMQEIPFLYRTDGDNKVSELSVFNCEENVSRALYVNWEYYDIMKRIE